MKKLLILAYDFPPYNSIGAQRPASWAKYLPEFDIEPVVITRHWDREIQSEIDYMRASIARTTATEQHDHYTVIRAPYNTNIRDKLILRFGTRKLSVIRRILSLYYSIVKFLIPQLDNYYSIYKTADEYLKSNSADIIVATGEPFILLKYASMLSRRYSIPWIADYRDGWNTNQEKKSLSLVNKVQLWMHRRFEASLLKNVSMATTAAPAYSDALQNLPYFSYPVKTIFNGYDNHTIDHLIPTLQRSDLFEIAYAGIFYDYQQVETFLSGYQMFIEQHQLKPNQTKAVFYGIEFYDGMKQRLYANESLRPYIRSTARLPYNEVLNELQKAHVLLILSQKGANWLSAKLFDYMAVKRKVLLVENDHGILESIIQECNAGVTAEDPKDVCDHLTSAYHIFLNTGGVKQESKNISTYSRKAQAEAFANVLKQYCN